MEVMSNCAVGAIHANDGAPMLHKLLQPVACTKAKHEIVELKRLHAAGAFFVLELVRQKMVLVRRSKLLRVHLDADHFVGVLVCVAVISDAD